MAKFGVVQPQNITLTSGTSSFTTIVGMLKQGDRVEILSESDDWLFVRHVGNNTQGYSPRSNFKIIDETPAEAAPSPAFTPYNVVTSSAGVRLRAGTGVQYPVITTLPQGRKLKVTGEHGEWLAVEYNGQTAYISAHLTAREDTSAMPSGYLIEQPDLLTARLEPNRLIPYDGLIQGKRPYAAARVWNTYGGLLELLAGRLKIPVATMVAVIATESSGKAFGEDNRVIIRFEVHVFYKYWGAANQVLFDKYFTFESWRNHKFRRNENAEWVAVHTSQAREHEVLEFARALDDTAALKSISMGAPQLMGFNYKALGYESVQDMYENFARSANAQILGMFDFVKGTATTSRAIRALQTGDYLTFASIYNGPGNAATYEAIIQDYVSIFEQLIPTAVTVTVDPSVTLRGPADLVAPPPTPEDLASIGAPSVAAVIPSTSTVAVKPAAAEVVIMARDKVNVRAQPSLSAALLGVIQRGEIVKLREPVEQALAKIEMGERGGQFLEIAYKGQNAFMAAWFGAPAKLLTPESVMAYIDTLPSYTLPAEYEMFWSHREKLGLPDPFDVLPVQIRSEAELTTMQVNGFGPNTFAMYYGAQWYSRIGYMHNGYDFIVKTGTPLYAVSDGVIIRNWRFMANADEKTLVLWCFLPEKYRDNKGRRMLSNVLVAYGHMSNNTLRKNHEMVKAGDVIGLSGTPAGINYNDHLHYEVHLLQGDADLPNKTDVRLLAEYKRPQNQGNRTPWNPLLFYTPRVIHYSLYQGEKIGFSGGKLPEYPSEAMLKAQDAAHLHPLTPMTLAYYRYGIANVWKKPTTGKKWQEGVVALDMLEARLKKFAAFEPYEASFLG